MAVDFSQLLSDKLDDVKRPPVKPAGTYNATIKEHKFDVSSKKGTPYVRFVFNNVTPGDDIDQDQLKDTDGNTIDLSKWQPSTRGLSDFYLTPESKFRLKEFIKAFNIETKGRSFNEILPELRGMPVLLTVSMKASEDGENFFNNIEQVTAA